MHFEYVASGVSHTRLTYPSHYNEPEIQGAIQYLLERIQNTNNHTFSVLYNAYTEADYPKSFRPLFGDKIDRIHADSGGLQVVTRGYQFTKELKEKVYKNQALNSDIAMSFDEIPVKSKNPGTNMVIQNMNLRVFDSSEFTNCAKKSRENLVEQIGMFLNFKEERRAKILPIIQGNSIDNYTQWYSILTDNLKEEERDLIPGLAFSTASFGIGIREEVERIVAMEKLKGHYTYGHLLGFGGLGRFLPLLILASNGFLSFLERISYDSTVHTGNANRGRYLDKRGIVLAARQHMNPAVITILEDIHTNLKTYAPDFLSHFGLSLDEEFLHQSICQPTLFAKHQEKKHRKAIYIFLFVISQVINLMELLESALTNKTVLKNIINLSVSRSVTERGVLMSLLDHVKSIDDYFYWQKTMSGFLKSAKIKDTQSMNDVDELF